MANALTLFDNTPQLPADIASFFTENENILPKETVPSLSYEGKVWTISRNGEKTKLMRTNQDGDQEPVPVMRVVILDYNQRRGRAYYEGAYDPTKPGMPVCWSDDGITSSEHGTKRQSERCASCKMSVKGSKVTEQGKAVTACSEHRMIVVVPAGKLDFEPLRLKLAITSDYDGQSPEHEAQGWYAFKNYTDVLRSKQVAHTAMLVTKMKFDPNVAYPKVLFSPDRWLEPDQLKLIPPIVKSETVKALVNGSWTPNGIDGTKQVAGPTDAGEKFIKPAAPVIGKIEPKVQKPADEEQTQPKTLIDEIRAGQAPVEDDDGVILPGTAPAKTAKAAAATKTPKAATAPKKADAAPATTSGSASDDLNTLLAEWA